MSLRRTGRTERRNENCDGRRRVLYDAFDVCAEGKGVSRALVAIHSALRDRNPPLEIIVATTLEGSTVLGVDSSALDVVIVPPVPGHRWEQWELPRLARRLACDVVYTQRECPPLWGPAIAVHLHEVPDVRWRYEQARTARELGRRAYERLLFARAIRHAQAVLVSSEATRNELVRWARVDVKVVPLGVDNQRFGDRGELRTQLLHIGSDDPRDLTDVVVSAYERCCRNRRMPPIVVCGDVSQKRPVDNVRWVGRVSDDDLVSLLNTALLCIQPSLHEGFGLQNLEAMSCGAPLIAYDAPAVREVVGDGARLLPEASAKHLANAILDLLDDEPARAAISASGRRRADNYAWANTARAIAETLTPRM